MAGSRLHHLRLALTAIQQPADDSPSRTGHRTADPLDRLLAGVDNFGVGGIAHSRAFSEFKIQAVLHVLLVLPLAPACEWVARQSKQAVPSLTIGKKGEGGGGADEDKSENG